MCCLPFWTTIPTERHRERLHGFAPADPVAEWMSPLCSALRKDCPNGLGLLVLDRCILCVLLDKLTISRYGAR
jgi:hypothetical protein